MAAAAERRFPVITPGPRDARLRELQSLARIERTGSLDLKDTFHIDPRDRDMYAELIHAGYLNGLGGIAWSYRSDFGYYENIKPENNQMIREIEYQRWSSLNSLLGGQSITLRLTHKGRVRLSELEQALKTGRDRDPTGTVISKRHLEKDLTIALVSAVPDAPVAVCMLDMNGLKQINDTVGHHAGDVAIDTYLKAIAVFLGEDAEGYRGDGGDELVVVVRGADAARAASLVRQALTQLAKEKAVGVPYLSASCGVTSTTDANTDAKELLSLVDRIQYRAKEESKKGASRSSAIAINDEPVEVLAPPVPPST